MHPPIRLLYADSDSEQLPNDIDDCDISVLRHGVTYSDFNHNYDLQSSTSEDPSTIHTSDHEEDDSVSPIPPDPPNLSSVPVPNTPWRPQHGSQTIFYSDDPISPEFLNLTIESEYDPSSMEYHSPLINVETLYLKLDLIIEKANCSTSVIDQIIGVFREAIVEDKVDFSSKSFCKYATWLRRMQNKFPSTAPLTVPVTLESDNMVSSDSDPLPHEEARPLHNASNKKRKIISNFEADQGYYRTNVVHFPFIEQVESLLSDAALMSDLSNFDVVINPDDPFGKFGSPDDSLDEIVDGQWYHNTYAQARSIVHDSNWRNDPFMVIPLILYLDKTGLDKYNRIIRTGSMAMRLYLSKPVLSRYRMSGITMKGSLRQLLS